MKPSETLKHIEDIESMHSYVGRYKTAYALLCSLPDLELMQYGETHRFPDFLMKLLTRRGLMDQFVSRQKTAASRLIRQLADPEAKNRSQLREGLKARYNLLPTAYREQILRCMLGQGTRKERLWVYTRLGWHWDDSFTQAIEQCFDKYHEVECAHLILNKFPASFIYEHREALAQLVGWRWVMSRAGKEYPDIVEREKLTSLEWAHVVVDLQLMEHGSDIETFLYHNISTRVDCILSGVYHQDCPQSLRDLPDVNWAVWALGQMGMADAIIRFQSFDRKFETFVPEDIDDENRAEMVYPWLCDVYDTFAVGMIGWPSRTEKGYTLEQYRKSRHVFTYGEEGIDSVDGWLTSPTDDIPSNEIGEGFPF